MAQRIRRCFNRWAVAAVGMIVLGLSTAGQGAPAPSEEARHTPFPERNAPLLSGDPASSQGKVHADSVEVSVTAPEKTVLEGQVGTFRVRRTSGHGTLRVSMQLGGTAVLDRDYRLDGFAAMSSEAISVAFAEGQMSTVMAVDVVDDVAAESLETVTLTLRPGAGYLASPDAERAQLTIAQNDTLVTTTADSGEGSLQQAILNANALKGPQTVRFDSQDGPFAEPQTIVLARPLPVLTGEITIDGRIEGQLWKATGVTVSGDRKHRVFKVSPGGRLTLLALTVAEGKAEVGAGLSNQGEAVVKGVTFIDNVAEQHGGALANSGGKLTVLNSTFAGNSAGVSGGGLVNQSGAASVTNCTFSENAAPRGAGLLNEGRLLLRNTILANSTGGADCASSGEWDPAGTHNLIEANAGCGTPIITADPRLGSLGGYNGPTSTFPLGGGSPAINGGDNGAALDEYGEPLVWDQRGNGDPRFVGGITDIGAFEQQMLPTLEVDTPEDLEIRACTRAGAADCSLRGAITLANAMGKTAHIKFDRGVFADAKALHLQRPLPPIVVEATLEGSSNGGIRIDTEGAFPVFRFQPRSGGED